MAYRDTKLLAKLPLPAQRRILLSAYFWDIGLFASDVTKRWTRDKRTVERVTSADFHFELWELLRDPQDILAIVSRDHGKTTVVSKILVLWFLLFEVEPSILLVMSKGLGEIVIGDIKKELETNRTIRLLFGQLVPIENRSQAKSEKWRQRELQLMNGTEVKTITKNEPVRGRRPTKVLVDDPQENKDVKNPIVANEFWHWVWTAVYPVLEDGGSMGVLGTVISSNCFVNKLKAESENRGFKVLEYPAIIGMDPKKDIETLPGGKIRFKAGRPLWPEHWSLEALQVRAQKIGLREFLQEYMNIPFVLNGSPVFADEYDFDVVSPISEDSNGVQYFKPEYVSEGKKLYSAVIGMDFARGSLTGDYQTIIARDPITFELLAQYRGHVSQDRLAKILDDLLTHFENFLIVPENNYAMLFLQEAKTYSWAANIYRTERMDKITNQVTETLGFSTNSKTKELAIGSLNQKFRENRWQITPTEKEEIEHYYFDESGGMNALSPHHDDLIIADAMCVIGMRQGLPAQGIFFI